MSEPLALLPLALAAAGGRVDAWSTTQLVAAGLTLLQRSAPLVRALAGRRSAIMLPNSPALITALAASDGRGALLLPPSLPTDELSRRLQEANVGAVFTNAVLAERLPEGVTVALLDDAPRSAHVIAPGRTMTVDLGSHHGLSLEGDRAAEGREEECVVWFDDLEPRPLTAITHRELLQNARRMATELLLTPVDTTIAARPLSDPPTLTCGVLAPLLAAGCVQMPQDHDAAALLSTLATVPATMLVGDAPMYAGILAHLEALQVRWTAPSLATCVCIGTHADAPLGARWTATTGTRLTWYSATSRSENRATGSGDDL
jgi:hypothetical protein